MGVNMQEKITSLVNEHLKLAYIINEFFGCNAMSCDVNSFELAKHLLDNGITLTEKAEPAKEEMIELDENVITEISLCLCSFYKKDCNRCSDCWARDKAIEFYKDNSNFMYLYLLYKSGRIERHLITSVYGLLFKDSDIVSYQRLGEKRKLDMFCLSCLNEYQISCCPIEEYEKQLKEQF